MLSCAVVSDLMVVYATGEASPETRRLVEEHLAQCPICRTAFGEESPIEDVFAAETQMDRTSQGSQFLTRTRRLIFAIGIGVLFLFTSMFAIFGRLVMQEVATIPLPHLPGSPAVLLITTGLAFVLYIALLLWRQRSTSDKGIVDFLLSLVTALPLLILAIIALDLVIAADALAAILAIMILLTALAITYLLLARLPYITWTTGLSLVLVIVAMFIQMIAGVVSLGDFTLESPASLGHPAEQVRLEEAARVDLGSLGLDWIANETITQLDGIRVSSAAKAFRAEYSGEEEQVFLSVIEFGNTEQSSSFFSDWKKANSNIRVTGFEINLPGLPGQGQILRFYSPQTSRAYSAWQNENWVTIIEVPGPFSQASPLAREVKELVAKHYNDGS